MNVADLFKNHLRAHLQTDREGLCLALREGSKKMKNK